MSAHAMHHPETICYAQESLSLDEFNDILQRSTLGERRPLNDPQRMQAMLDHANVTVTARTCDGMLVGVARSLSDFAFCCYVSDLAVDEAYQHRGIGKALLQKTRELIGDHTQLLLLSAPAAHAYYPRIGFRHVENAWTVDAFSEWPN